MSQKIFKTPNGYYWIGHGDGILCAPPAEFLKKHNSFVVLLADGQTATYRHLDAKDDTWVFPFNQHIIGWTPLFEGEARGDNYSLQCFLIMNTPASGEVIELSDVQVLDKGAVRIAVRTPLSISAFFSVPSTPH